MKGKAYPCPHADMEIYCNNSDTSCEGCPYYKEQYETVTSTGTTTKKRTCKHTGFYHTVNFLCFKKRFLACEKCGTLIPQGGWRFNI